LLKHDTPLPPSPDNSIAFDALWDTLYSWGWKLPFPYFPLTTFNSGWLLTFISTTT
jgi:hypothetical protein